MFDTNFEPLQTEQPPNTDISVINQPNDSLGNEATDLWKQAEMLVESGKQVVTNDILAAAEVMEKVEYFAKQSIEQASSVVDTIIGDDQNIQESPLPPPKGTV